MNDFEIFNNYSDSVCIFNTDGNIIFKNKVFKYTFADCNTLERFKKRFNFNLCLLSSEYLEDKTPINILLQSKENFHTVCTYQNQNGTYIYYYIYSFKYNSNTVAVFRDISSLDKVNSIEKEYNKLQDLYTEAKINTGKFAKLQEHAQAQVLKMGIINRISLVIRETNDIKTILTSALEEIHNLSGSFKTYFSVKEKNNFKTVYSIPEETIKENEICTYEEEVIKQIKDKKILITPCLKEHLNSKDILPKDVKRIIIPIHNKNRLLGIIATFTKQKVNLEDNIEILQSIAVQLSSSIIQAGLIQQLNKKNKKLKTTLSELKSTQMQLINSEKMASIGQLVSGVAHEINTPLASISSNNKMISKILSEVPDKNRLDMIKELNSIDIEAVNRISDIVKSLKRFVRLDEAEFQEADINSELDLTLKLITHETKNNIEVIKRYSPLPPVLCSVNMLNQVFMNILVNACQSIRETGKDGKIIISTDTDNDKLVVKIKDNGAGIPDNIQNKIFSVGFTTKKAGIGTGLGLSISKKIIEHHKGTITFKSKQGEGTEFTVTIPVNSN